MKPENLAILKARLEGLKNTLSQTTVTLTDPISHAMVHHYNGILNSIAEECPDIRDQLPNPINTTTDLGDFQETIPDANYIDLQAFAEELISVVNLLESGE